MCAGSGRGRCGTCAQVAREPLPGARGPRWADPTAPLRGPSAACAAVCTASRLNGFSRNECPAELLRAAREGRAVATDDHDRDVTGVPGFAERTTDADAGDVRKHEVEEHRGERVAEIPIMVDHQDPGRVQRPVK